LGTYLIYAFSEPGYRVDKIEHYPLFNYQPRRRLGKIEHYPLSNLPNPTENRDFKFFQKSQKIDVKKKTKNVTQKWRQDTEQVKLSITHCQNDPTRQKIDSLTFSKKKS
jgi:hypothetical protein